MTSPRSMRFQIEEVLSGMLASFPADEFTDDSSRLGEAFKLLSGEFPLFGPYAALAEGGDFSKVLEDALGVLTAKKSLTHTPGRFSIPEAGRLACQSSKRTLFNKSDVTQLEEAARRFAEQLQASA